MTSYEIYRTAALQQATAPADWQWVCRQWRLDAARPAYGVVYAKDADGLDVRLITTDVDFVHQLPDRGPVPDHNWLEVRTGWFVAD